MSFFVTLNIHAAWRAVRVHLQWQCIYHPRLACAQSNISTVPCWSIILPGTALHSACMTAVLVTVFVAEVALAGETNKAIGVPITLLHVWFYSSVQYIHQTTTHTPLSLYGKDTHLCNYTSYLWMWMISMSLYSLNFGVSESDSAHWFQTPFPVTALKHGKGQRQARAIMGTLVWPWTRFSTKPMRRRSIGYSGRMQPPASWRMFFPKSLALRTKTQNTTKKDSKSSTPLESMFHYVRSTLNICASDTTNDGTTSSSSDASISSSSSHKEQQVIKRERRETTPKQKEEMLSEQLWWW